MGILLFESFSRRWPLSVMVTIKRLGRCAIMKETAATCLPSCQRSPEAREVGRKSNNLPQEFLVRSVSACHRHDNRDPCPRVGNWTPGSEWRTDAAGCPPSGNKLKLFGVFTRRNHSARVRGTKRANRTAACFSCLPPTRDGPASVVSGRRALVAMETLAGKGAACSFSFYFFLMKLF